MFYTYAGNLFIVFTSISKGNKQAKKALVCMPEKSGIMSSVLPVNSKNKGKCLSESSESSFMVS